MSCLEQDDPARCLVPDHPVSQLEMDDLACCLVPDDPVPGRMIVSLLEPGGAVMPFWCPAPDRACPSGIGRGMVSPNAFDETQSALCQLVSPVGSYLTTVVWTGSPACSSPGSVFRPDPVGLVLALAGPCLTTVVRAGSPTRSSPGLFSRRDRFWHRTYGGTPISSVLGAWVKSQP